MVRNSYCRFNAETAKTAERIVLCVVCVLGGSFRIVAAPPVRIDVRRRAGARAEGPRRAGRAGRRAGGARRACTRSSPAYEAVVRRYPASGYSDNALVAGAPACRSTRSRDSASRRQGRGVRLLKKLASMYPTSKLAKQVPEQLTRTNSGEIRVPEDAVVSHTPPPASRPAAATAARAATTAARPRCERAGVDPASPRSRTSAAPCCPTPCGSPSSSTPKCRSTKSASRIRRASSSISPAPAPRRRWSIRPSASKATPTSSGRCGSAGIRTTPRASCSTRPGSRATASTRSTARTGW